MKVWIVTEEFSPSTGEIAFYTDCTANGLGGLGVDVSVLHFDKRHRGKATHAVSERYRKITFNEQSLSGEELEMPAIGSYAADSYRIAWFLKKSFEELGSPDAIEFHDFGAIAYFALQARATLDPYYKNIKIYLTAHRSLRHNLEDNEQSAWRLPNYFIGEMEKFCHIAADAVIYPSIYTKDRFRSENLVPAYSYVLPNPLPLKQPHHTFDWNDESIDIRQIAPFDKTIPSVGFFGRLQIRDGIIEFLHSMEQFCSEDCEVRVSLHGSDALYDNKDIAMSEWITKRYSKRVEAGLLQLHGEYKRSQVPLLCAQYSAIVFPHRGETFSYTLAEIILSGSVPVVSCTGGHKELIPEDQSWLIYDSTEADSFRAVLSRVLSLSESDRKALSDRLQKHVFDHCDSVNIMSRKMHFINYLKTNGSEFFPFVSQIPCSSSSISSDGIKGLVSVVIPYYNLGHLTEETIESVMHSTYDNVEVIVVNDGSTDAESIDFLTQINHSIQRYPVKVVNKDNGGVSTARNLGATIAKGEFIFFLDADDLVEPDFLRRSVEILQTYRNVDFVGGWIKEFGASNGSWVSWNPEPPYILFQNQMHCSFTARRDVWLQFGRNDERVKYGMEDYDSIISMVKNGARGVAIPEYNIKYRIRAGSAAKGLNLSVREYTYNLLASKHAAAFSKYGRDLVLLSAENGPGYLISTPTMPAQFGLQQPAPVNQRVWNAKHALQQGRHQEAKACATSALALDNESNEARFILARVFHAQDELDLAIDYYRSIADTEYASYDWAQLHLFSALVDRGYLNAAESMFRDHMHIRPEMAHEYKGHFDYLSRQLSDPWPRDALKIIKTILSS